MNPNLLMLVMMRMLLTSKPRPKQRALSPELEILQMARKSVTSSGSLRGRHTLRSECDLCSLNWGLEVLGESKNDPWEY